MTGKINSARDTRHDPIPSGFAFAVIPGLTRYPVVLTLLSYRTRSGIRWSCLCCHTGLDPVSSGLDFAVIPDSIRYPVVLTFRILLLSVNQNPTPEPLDSGSGAGMTVMVEPVDSGTGMMLEGFNSRLFLILVGVIQSFD